MGRPPGGTSARLAGGDLRAGRAKVLHAAAPRTELEGARRGFCRANSGSAGGAVRDGTRWDKMGHGRGEARHGGRWGEAGKDDGTRGLPSLRSNKRRVYDSKKVVVILPTNACATYGLSATYLKVTCGFVAPGRVEQPFGALRSTHSLANNRSVVFWKSRTRRKFDRRRGGRRPAGWEKAGGTKRGGTNDRSGDWRAGR